MPMKYLIYVLVLAAVTGCRPNDPFPAQDAIVTPAGAVFEFEDKNADHEYYRRVSDDAVHTLTSTGVATPEEVKQIFARAVIFVGADESYFKCGDIVTNGCTSDGATLIRLSATAAPLAHEMLHVLAELRGVSDDDNAGHVHWGEWNASTPSTVVTAGHFELLGSWYNVTDIATARWTYIYENHINIPAGWWIGGPALVPVKEGGEPDAFQD
jgi:hypothetical protein